RADDTTTKKEKVVKYSYACFSMPLPLEPPPPPLWREWRVALLLLALAIVYTVPFYLPFFSEAGRQPGFFVTGLDWDQHYFYHAAVYRSVVDFRQWPFWNPWQFGGSSMWGNPQMQFPTPTFLATLVFGPLNGVRLQVFLLYLV